MFSPCRTNELREKISGMQDDVRQLDMDIEENQGKYYLETFPVQIIVHCLAAKSWLM